MGLAKIDLSGEWRFGTPEWGKRTIPATLPGEPKCLAFRPKEDTDLEALQKALTVNFLRKTCNQGESQL